jgi:hypothetical protein
MKLGEGCNTVEKKGRIKVKRHVSVVSRQET